MNIGDVIKIKKKYRDLGTFAIVVGFETVERVGQSGWISTDYIVMSNTGKIYRVASVISKKLICEL